MPNEYRKIPVSGRIDNQPAFEKAADEVIHVITELWGNECSQLVAEPDGVIGLTHGKHKVRVRYE